VETRFSRTRVFLLVDRDPHRLSSSSWSSAPDRTGQGSFFFFDHGFISFVCHGADVKLIVLLYYLPPREIDLAITV
jgi:hypothetical protein